MLSTKVPGKVTVEGVKENVETCLAYTAAWMGGNGCIPLNHLMEDAATAEITRVQLWQWVHYNTRLSDTGELITASYVDNLIGQLAPGLDKIVAGLKPRDAHGKHYCNHYKVNFDASFFAETRSSVLTAGCRNLVLISISQY